MINVKLFKNKYNYPKFSRSLTQVGEVLQCTPLNINSTNGEILTQNFSELHNANYISLEIDNVLLYAWIDSIEHYSGEKRYKIKYTVDGFRSYIDKVDLGVQYIKRSPTPSNELDPMLRGHSSSSTDLNITVKDFENRGLRTLVVVASLTSNQPSQTYLKTPIQPTPYILYFCDYPVNNWTSVSAIVNLITKLNSSQKPINITTIYSTPYIADSNRVPSPLRLEFESGGEDVLIEGFHLYTQVPKLYTHIKIDPPSDSLRQTPHSRQIVIGESGIMSVGEELLYRNDLYLRRDIDIYSGATNFSLMLYNENENIWKMTPYSLRGSAMQSIPIAYSPEQQLLAMSQTNRNTALFGDVANLVVGGAQIVGGILGAGATGGLSLAMAGSGLMQAGSTIVDMTSREEILRDSLNAHQNPSAFLGSALGATMYDRVFIITKSKKKDNSELVRSLYGYPQNKLMNLSLPSRGFIQTQECNVSGNIPKYGLEEINSRFNQGINVQ